MDNSIEIPKHTHTHTHTQRIKLPYAPKCIFLNYGCLWNWIFSVVKNPPASLDVGNLGLIPMFEKNTCRFLLRAVQLVRLKIIYILKKTYLKTLNV